MQLATFFSTHIAHAADNTEAPQVVRTFVGKVNEIIVNPLIILLFAAALVYFLYGVFQFIQNADNAEKRETGQQHMMWGLIGMLIMFGVFGLIHIIEGTLGLTPNANFR
jgi:succinate dehydrogenase/fumarate reductase cytochrome b subunit